MPAASGGRSRSPDESLAQGVERRSGLYVVSEGPDQLAVAADRSALAAILDAQGRHREAMAPLRAAIDILEAELGRDHYEVAVLLSTFAAVAVRAGDAQQAEESYSRALWIQRRVLGDGHADVRETRLYLQALRKRR